MTRVRFEDVDWAERWNGHSVLGLVLAKIDYRDTNGCWIWTASHSDTGYGTKNVKGVEYVAHRLVFRLYYGPIPAGMHLDHLCRVHSCVNPEHLEPVTAGENILRGAAPSAITVRSNRCYRGHELTPENTYTRPDGGGRQCLTCVRARTSSRQPRDPNLPIKSHCIHGHELAGDNLSFSRLGFPRCAECLRAGQRRRRAAKSNPIG